jgi:hypothetical protein
MHLFNKVILISNLDKKVDNNQIKGYKVSDDFLYLICVDGFYKLDRRLLSDDELINILERDISGDLSSHFKKEIRDFKILKVVNGSK